jgi:hypothetical protein
MRNAIHFLGGSFTVYALMAACSAGGKGKTGNGDEMASSGGAIQAAGGVNGNSGGVDGVNDPTAGKSNGMGGIIGEMMDPVPDANANESGSRLKAKYYIGADGSKQFTFVWRDTQRDEDCTFGRVAGGELRCIPATSAIRIYFADSGCTQPIWMSGKTAATSTCDPTAGAKYGYTADAAGCSDAIHSLQPTTPTMIYNGTPAQCIASAPPDVYTYFTSAGVVAFSEFVAATEQVGE